MASTRAVSPRPVIVPARRASTTTVDAVVWAGATDSHSSWTGGLPPFVLPLPRRTLLDGLITRLCGQSSGLCTICTDGWPEDRLGSMRVNGVDQHRVSIHTEPIPRGNAGCLKACAARLRKGPVLLIGASVRLDEDPSRLVAQHKALGHAMTVFCTRHPPRSAVSARQHLKPAGVYCLDSDVLARIPDDGYFDLAEQLLPVLRRAGLPVGVSMLTGDTCDVADWRTYLGFLDHELSGGHPPDEGFHSPAPGVWFGRGVEVASDARIVGPVILGHGCVVGREALIVGPAVLGDDSHVGAGTWLVRVVAPGALWCPPDAGLADRVVRGTTGLPPRSRSGEECLRTTDEVAAWL